jgi:hypothetical protein
MPPYLTVDDAYDALIGLPSIRALVKSDDETFLRTLLEMSAGTDLANQRVYRIFWVAANFLSQSAANQAILEESSYLEVSVKYDKREIQQAIDALLNLQNSQDLPYKVPNGFEALPVTMSGAFESGSSYWTQGSTEELLENIEFYHA